MARRRSVVRRHLVVRLTSERFVPLAVAITVLVAGAVSLGPSLARPVGAAQADQPGVRLAIGGGVAGADYAQTELAGLLGLEGANGLAGQYVDDGTLYKPVAVDTSIESASDLLRHYTVRSGDTLVGIAGRYDVSVMTIWWANHLTSTTQLHVGQNLVIPPVNGLVVTVAAGDTLDTLAAHYKVTADAIVNANELTDTNLIVGQVLVMPGAKGAPIPTPKVTVVAKSSGGTSGGGIRYTGGTWRWPVVGGGNYISQYFWSGHQAIDVAAQYGSVIVAPRAGSVIYAGWNSDGCGYSVEMSIGSGLYLEMCHMSAVRVHVGQVVSKGQQVGNVGTSGWATGPHCHLAVWVGYPWHSGSYRVNPLRYY
ncbi:MAG TPA: LysM peptidoglycan-binding domain-containing protein [Candidatus Acidoferrales bacterium]|nr:LysM peptidoglycan-binding domain-containing protein [Candidatus Acidoferrales bacterium]